MVKKGRDLIDPIEGGDMMRGSFDPHLMRGSVGHRTLNGTKKVGGKNAKNGTRDIGGKGVQGPPGPKIIALF